MTVKCLELRLAEEVTDLQNQVDALQNKVYSLQQKNTEKVKRLITMKLQASTLRYQINKYRNEETEKLSQYMEYNQDLQSELAMVKKTYIRKEEQHSPLDESVASFKYSRIADLPYSLWKKQHGL